MNAKHIVTYAFLVFTSLALLAGCGSAKQNPPTAAAPLELNISAAISMKDALTEIQKNYTAKNPNVKIIYNLGSSGTLQKQIEQGAPADLFISAAPKQMDELEAKNLILKQTRRNLVENQLVLITAKNSPLGLTNYADLAKEAVKKFSIGEPETVPAGQYAQQVLIKLELWDTLKNKAVLAKDARTVLTYVETGNVEAGIVYRTDASSSDKVQIVSAAPVGSHKPILYPAAVLSGAKQSKAAEDFLAYLYGSEAKTVFEKHGFVVNK